PTSFVPGEGAKDEAPKKGFCLRRAKGLRHFAIPLIGFGRLHWVIQRGRFFIACGAENLCPEAPQAFKI
ncbi:hypothetical protein ACTGWA_11010, partial [Streptococcus suis]